MGEILVLQWPGTLLFGLYMIGEGGCVQGSTQETPNPEKPNAVWASKPPTWIKPLLPLNHRCLTRRFLYAHAPPNCFVFLAGFGISVGILLGNENPSTGDWHCILNTTIPGVQNTVSGVWCCELCVSTGPPLTAEQLFALCNLNTTVGRSGIHQRDPKTLSLACSVQGYVHTEHHPLTRSTFVCWVL